MVANYTFTWSVPAYDAFSHFLETMPYKDLLEITVIFAPLVAHALIGIYIVATGSCNVGSYRYMRNWRYLFQRITGVIAFAFLLWHVIGLKWGVSLLPDGGSTFELVRSVVADPWALAAFVLGVYSCLYHFSQRPLDLLHHVGHYDHAAVAADHFMDLLRPLRGGSGLRGSDDRLLDLRLKKERDHDRFEHRT